MGRFFSAMTVWFWAVAAAAPAHAIYYNNEFDVSLLGLATGFFNFNIEHTGDGSVSGFGGFGYSQRGYLFVDEPEGVTWRYVNLKGGAKYYPMGGFRDFFLSGEVNVGFNMIEDKSTGESSTDAVIVPVFLVGWRWVFAGRGTLTPGVGLAFGTEEIHAGGHTIDTFGVWPAVDLTLGFLF